MKEYISLNKEEVKPCIIQELCDLYYRRPEIMYYKLDKTDENVLNKETKEIYTEEEVKKAISGINPDWINTIAALVQKLPGMPSYFFAFYPDIKSIIPLGTEWGKKIIRMQELEDIIREKREKRAGKAETNIDLLKKEKMLYLAFPNTYLPKTPSSNLQKHEQKRRRLEEKYKTDKTPFFTWAEWRDHDIQEEIKEYNNLLIEYYTVLEQNYKPSIKTTPCMDIQYLLPKRGEDLFVRISQEQGTTSVTYYKSFGLGDKKAGFADREPGERIDEQTAEKLLKKYCK